MNKFIDNIGEQLNEIALNGFTNDQCGSVSEYPNLWSGLILDSGIEDNQYAIIQEDDQGFFDYRIFKTAAAAQKKFNDIQKHTLKAANYIDDHFEIVHVK